MNQSDHIQLLKETLARLDDTERWLLRSYTICSKIGLKENYTDEEYDAFETLTSRFARVGDLLLQKVFRTIDQLELEDTGTLLDALNRAEKRGLVDSADSFRAIRELRNEIAHEYRLEDLQQLFAKALELSDKLFAYIDQSKQYCEKYTTNTGDKKE